ncbi:hypothetical protein Patl1_27485 [Pistacia atlantica]|uniref:Uncharacterized protein n=1 Tax=Pistacia atlantica TaxID=434234 RepID=A0ACC1BEI9_9ROSI|nr:hypothetical protein Patl1_27485 [Pistacia atlantica]
MPPTAMDFTTPALGTCRALTEPMASFFVEETSLLIYAKFVSRSIFSDMEEDPHFYWENQNNGTHRSQFNRSLADLMNSLVHEAVSSSNFFAAEDVNFTTFTRLYGLAQCTPDIVSSECRICLAACAWRNWIEGNAVNLIDPNLRVGSNRDMMRCIHIGLLCVQENVANRPTMASVVLMLTGGPLSLPTPSKPAYFMHSSTKTDKLESPTLHLSKNYVQFSLNETSITELEPR